MGNQEMKSVIERYCPIVKRNVAVEITPSSQKSNCLHSHDCFKKHGECKNTIINEK